jgi:hypothetical protein
LKVKLLILIVCSAVVFSPASSFSQEEKDWDFAIAPLYLWATNINGESGVGDQTAETNIKFGDIYDNLQGVLTVRLNALYRKKFGLVLDYTYLDLGNEKQTDIVNIETSFKAQILNFAGTYRFLDGMHMLEGVAGIRYTGLDLEVELLGTGNGLEENKNWVDPIVGARYTYRMADKWALRFYGDIGGFGVASDFTWQGLGLIDFQPWKHMAIIAGYRAIATDYESGSGRDKFTYDVIVHGPVLGLDIRF